MNILENNCHNTLIFVFKHENMTIFAYNYYCNGISNRKD